MSAIDQLRRQDVGEPGNGGQFAGRRNTEATVSLLGWPSSVPEPTQDQRARAAQAAARKVQWNGAPASAAEVEALTVEFTHRLAEQEAAYESWKAGEPHLDDPLYEDIWSGRAVGTSEESARTRLNRAVATLDRVIDAEEPPTDETLHRLEEEILLYEEALECGGRNLSINQGNVLQAKRIQFPVPF